MLTCEQMAELGSDFIDRRLSRRMRLAVLLHVRKCPHCSRYIKQLQLTSQALQALPFDDEPVDSRAILARVHQPQGASH